MAQDRDRWRELVNAVKMRVVSLLAEDMLNFQEGLCSMELWK